MAPIVTPTQLVNEFKKSGEFEQLRRELLEEFKHGKSANTLKARVDDIARRKLESDKKMMLMSAEETHAELMEELERYPLIDRAMSDFQGLENDTFISNLRQNLGDLLAESRAEGSGSSSRAHRRRSLSEHSAEVDDDSAEDSDSSDEFPSRPADSDDLPRSDEPEETSFTKEETSVDNIPDSDLPEDTRETSPPKSDPITESLLDKGPQSPVKLESISSPKELDITDNKSEDKTIEIQSIEAHPDRKEVSVNETIQEATGVTVKLEQIVPNSESGIDANDRQRNDAPDRKVDSQRRQSIEPPETKSEQTP